MSVLDRAWPIQEVSGCQVKEGDLKGEPLRDLCPQQLLLSCCSQALQRIWIWLTEDVRRIRQMKLNVCLWDLPCPPTKTISQQDSLTQWKHWGRCLWEPDSSYPVSQLLLMDSQKRRLRADWLADWRVSLRGSLIISPHLLSYPYIYFFSTDI